MITLTRSTSIHEAHCNAVRTSLLLRSGSIYIKDQFFGREWTHAVSTHACFLSLTAALVTGMAYPRENAGGLGVLEPSPVAAHRAKDLVAWSQRAAPA